jgi:signal transduction histidine kinase
VTALRTSFAAAAAAGIAAALGGAALLAGEPRSYALTAAVIALCAIVPLLLVYAPVRRRMQRIEATTSGLSSILSPETAGGLADDADVTRKLGTAVEALRGQIERERLAVERLEQVRREFLDNFSHEVRTPLAGLRSAVETLMHEGLSREEEGELRNIALRQASRLEILARDIAELNRIESGEIALAREPVDLLELARSVADDFSRRTGGEPPIEVSGSPAIAWADRARAEQVVANLVDNGIKHGGRRQPVTIDVRSSDGEAVLRVSDRGEGIPEGEHEKIFHRFYRVDKSRAKPAGGTGLGLAITKHLMRAHGGQVRVESAPGEGATFEVRFPAAPS